MKINRIIYLLINVNKIHNIKYYNLVSMQYNNIFLLLLWLYVLECDKIRVFVFPIFQKV
jgi:hypothetical protein